MYFSGPAGDLDAESLGPRAAMSCSFDTLICVKRDGQEFKYRYHGSTVSMGPGLTVVVLGELVLLLYRDDLRP